MSDAELFDEIYKENMKLRAAIERLTRERDDMVMVCDSYAAENQRLFDRAEAAERKLDALRTVMRPFADVAYHDIGDDESDADLFAPILCNHAPHITVGDMRRVLKALEETNE